MITDEERRNVAAKLREPKESLLAYADEELIRLRCEVRCVPRQNLYERLADLIDRPTCKYVPIGDGRFGCSWCGHVVKLDYDVLIADEIHIPFNYCPNCSAEVVEDVIFVSALDSPNSPSSNAAGCYSYEKWSRNG